MKFELGENAERLWDADNYQAPSQQEALPASEEPLGSLKWWGQGGFACSRSWVRWSNHEDQLLRQHYYTGLGIAELAKLLQRGQRAIEQRLKRLGLLPASYKKEPLSPQARLPVPQMDWVPSWRDHAPDKRWIEETAKFWGVSEKCFNEALQTLENTHWTVFVLRYGLAGRCSYTLRSVAAMLGMEPQAIRRIQKDAENRMRSMLVELGCEPIAATLEQTLHRCYGDSRSLVG